MNRIKLFNFVADWRERIDSLVANQNLTYTQFIVLQATELFTRNGAVTNQHQLVRHLGMDQNTLCQIIIALEKKGMITRKFTNDSRSKNPSVTAIGNNALEVTIDAVAAIDKEFEKLFKEECA